MKGEAVTLAETEVEEAIVATLVMRASSSDHQQDGRQRLDRICWQWRRSWR